MTFELCGEQVYQEKTLYMAVISHVCVCVLGACASLGLCQLKTVVCRTVILSNGLSLPADVLVSAPQLHPTCFHAVRQCSYILFLCKEL